MPKILALKKLLMIVMIAIIGLTLSHAKGNGSLLDKCQNDMYYRSDQLIKIISFCEKHNKKSKSQKVKKRIIKLKSKLKQLRWEETVSPFENILKHWKQHFSEPEVAASWLNRKISISKYLELKNIGIGNTTEYDRWHDAVKTGVFLGMGANSVIRAKKYFKTVPELKKYLKKYNFSRALLLKESKLKETKLVVSVLNNSLYYDPNNLHYNSKQFIATIKALKKARCKTVEKIVFHSADIYRNKGKCYAFSAKMIQRITKDTGLFESFNINSSSNNSNKGINLIFNGSWNAGVKKDGFVKGLGNFKYQTATGYMNNIQRGKVILIKPLSKNY